MTDEERKFLKSEIRTVFLSELEGLPRELWLPTGTKTDDAAKRDYYQFKHAFSEETSQIEESVRRSKGKHRPDSHLTFMLEGMLYDFVSHKVSFVELVEMVKDKEIQAALYLLVGNLIGSAFGLGGVDKVDVVATMRHGLQTQPARDGKEAKAQNRKKGLPARTSRLRPKVLEQLSADPTADSKKIFAAVYGHLSPKAKRSQRRNRLRDIDAVLEGVRRKRHSE